MSRAVEADRARRAGRTSPESVRSSDGLARAVGAEHGGDAALRAPRRRRRRARRTGAVGASRARQPAASDLDARGRRRARAGSARDLGGRARRRCAGRSRARRRGRRPTSRGPCGARRAATAMSPRRPRMQLAELVACRRRRARRPARRAAAAAARATSARASATRFWTGKGSDAGRAVGDVGDAELVERRRARPRAARARRGRSAAGRAAPTPRPARRRRSAPAMTFSSAVSPANRPTPCSVRAMPEAGELVRADAAAAARRATRRRRRPARTKPQMTLNSVVLPAPLGPMTPTTSPGETVSETSSSAVRPPKRTVTASMRSPSASAPWSAVTTHSVRTPRPGPPRPAAWRHGRVATPCSSWRGPNFRRRVVAARTTQRSSSRSTGSARRASGSSPVMRSR